MVSVLMCIVVTPVAVSDGVEVSTLGREVGMGVWMVDIGVVIATDGLMAVSILFLSLTRRDYG